MAKVEDHRVRVARERRDRMRSKLLATVMSTTGRLDDGLPTVDDVIRDAEVSRATFYKYFSSVEEVAHILGNELVDEMAYSLRALLSVPTIPFLQMTAGIQLFLMRSVTDPLWAAFVTRTDYISRDTELLKVMTRHLTQCRKEGQVHFDDIESAVSLFVGALMEAMRHLVRSGKRKRAYIEELSVMILLGLGVERAVAIKTVRERAQFIRDLAPDRLPWWRDPWD
jgi:AcrR family transcriptional regulator